MTLRYIGAGVGSSVQTDEIDDGAITTPKIASNAVDGTKIAMGSDAQGDVLFYGGTDYERLAPGTTGKYLKTQGAAADPIWDTITEAGFEFVETVTLAGATTTITFSSLDASRYKLVGVVKNDSGTSGHVMLYADADTTATNYYRQSVNFSAAAVDAGRANDASIGYTDTGTDNMIECMVAVGPDKMFFATSNSTQAEGATIKLNLRAISKTSALSLTTLDSLTISTTGNMAIGTSFTLFKLRSA